MKSYALIVNPCSGRGRGVRKAEELRRGLRDASEVQLLLTGGRGDATAIAAEVAASVDRVIAIGGDGTLHEVLNGLMDSRIQPEDRPDLGFLPAGTANVATRAFRLGSDPTLVGTALANAEATAIDVGMVDYEGGRRAFLLWCGAGWDAVIIHALNASRSGLMGVFGLLRRLPQVVGAVVRYDQPRIFAVVDGVQLGGLGSVIVANVGEIGFGGLVTDAADPADGRFNVVGVPPSTALGSIGLGFRMMVSSLSRSSAVYHEPGREITLRAEGEVPFQLDGEPVGMLPATVTLMQGAVRILRSK